MKRKLEDSIVDARGSTIARVQVEGTDADGYSGNLYFERIPEELANLFSLYEKYVNDQIFSLVDEVQDKILSFELRLQNEKKLIQEIQVFGNEVYMRI